MSNIVPPLRVLIVEDQPEIRKLIRLTLDIGRYDIAEAASGHEALASMAATLPQVVILDVMMPGADGLEVCRHIRKDARLAHAKILLLTARGQEGDKAAGIAAGADRYLVKPFSPLELMRIVEELASGCKPSR